MKSVHEGRNGYKMKASDLPSFLYPHETIYDMDNLDSGLFRGHVLIRVSFFFVWIFILLLANYVLFRDYD